MVKTYGSVKRYVQRDYTGGELRSERGLRFKYGGNLFGRVHVFQDYLQDFCFQYNINIPNIILNYVFSLIA